MARIGCSQRNLESTSLVYRRLFSCPGGLGRRGFRKATYGQSAQVYPVDPGLIPVFDLSGRANLSHALETIVRIELEPQGMDVRYVSTREGFEVGFMASTARFGARGRILNLCHTRKHPKRNRFKPSQKLV
jgi:predicted AAA+ superfamily ATPase